jgi:NHLM bacteriocin system ABC transporter ATP-binding protein
MMDTQLSERLILEHPTVEAGSDRPFPLAGERVWWVRAGRVDLFTVPLMEGAATGARTHLLRVEEGGLVLGTGAVEAGVAFLAVGGAGTRLVELDRAALQALARSPRHGPAVCALVEGWVESLCAGITRRVPQEESVALATGAESSPADSARVRPDRRVGWVKHLQGESLLLGQEGLKVNGRVFTPLSERTWIQVGPNSRLRVEPTETLLAGDTAWSGVDALHARVRRFAARSAERQTESERERLRAKASRSSGVLQDALSRLAGTLDPAAPRAAAPAAVPGRAEPEMDPLLAAARRVGEVLDIAVEPLPVSAGAAPQRDPLATLARANRFRTRQVVLRDGWWREDCGPLLSWAGEERRPVALVSVRGPGYLLFDPVRGEEVPVTAALAAEVSPLAQSFYRPFPDRSMGIRDLLSFGLRGCRRDVLTVLGMGVAGGVLSLVVPLAMARVFNDIIPGAARSELVQLSAVLLVIAVASALFAITSGIALVRLESRMGSAVQAGVWDRLLSLPMTFFRAYTAGDLARRAMGIDAIRRVLSGATATALLGGVFSLFHLGLLFYYSMSLAGWAVLLIAISIAVTLTVGWFQVRQERMVTSIQNRLAGQVLQFLTSISKLRIAAAETQAFALWADRFGRQRQIQFRARSSGDGLAAFQAGFPLLASLVLYSFGAPLLEVEDGMRTGDFLAFMSSFAICLTGLLSACAALVGAIMIIPLYEEALPILRAVPEVDTTRTDPGVLSGEIEVQRLSFRYGTEGPLVLRDVSLRIRAGEYVAFVGPSGSGKSTLMRLLLGLESPGGGALYFDGQELAGLDVQAVRRQMGVVLQSGRLMSGDLFTNIAGSAGATLDEAWGAAEMAGFDEDIRAMPMGMHTVVSENGGTLSGGQRQRLLIARAIVRKPRILLFDEATSALDNRTQAIVSQSLDRLQATRIVIAHRLSTIVNADRICVVQNGRIVQQGRYGELMEQGGLFAELARRQLS